MSSKRTSGSDQDEDNAKRAKIGDIEISQMPVELIYTILVKVVAMEVKSMKLVKSVWKEKVDLVISRLRTVCPQWDSIFTTNFFRNELNRTLDATEEKELRFDVVRRCAIPLGAIALTSVGRETFVLRKDQKCGYVIEVFDDPNNGSLPRNTIFLVGKHPEKMVGCTKTGAIFLLVKEVSGSRILRIEQCGPNQFRSQTWVTGIHSCVLGMFSSPDGFLLITTVDTKRGVILRTYDEFGWLDNELLFDQGETGIKYVNSAYRNSNGNTVLVAGDGQNGVQLREIDRNGGTVRVYESCLPPGSTASLADGSERVVLDSGSDKDLILLDSEFNLLKFTGGSGCSGLNGVCFFDNTLELTSSVLDIGNDAITASLIYLRLIENA